jgi:hypothetical protein
VEVDPAISGRWGPSIVLLPAGSAADALDGLSREVSGVAGTGHWTSATTGAAHVTLRALQRWGSPATPGQVDALRRSFVEPVTLAFDGVRVTPTAVLAMATDADGAGDRLRMRLGEEMGADGWLERSVLGPAGRDIWYVTLLHVASDDLDRDAVAAWSPSRAIGRATFDAAHVCEWRFDGRRMVPDVIDTVRCR